MNWSTISVRGFSAITNKGLVVNPFDSSIKEVKPTSTLFYSQKHSNFTTTVTINFPPKSEKELAGITCLQSESFKYVFGITKKDEDFYLLLERTEKGSSKIVASTKIDLKNPISLRVKAVGDKYEFSYSANGADFVNVGGIVSGDILSTNVAGGFTGALIGLYATLANNAIP